MRQLQSIFSGIVGMMIACFLAVFSAVCALIAISLWLNRGSEGEIGWDPVSLAKQHPVILVALAAGLIWFLVFGFLRGYRFRARRLART